MNEEQLNEYDTKAKIVDLLYGTEVACKRRGSCRGCRSDGAGEDCYRLLCADVLYANGLRFIPTDRSDK